MQNPFHELSYQALKILTAEEVRQADAFTIANEPISSLALMERAAAAAVKLIENNIRQEDSILVICGTGNNGGDGFAIARMLYQNGYNVSAVLVNHSGRLSDDCRENFQRLADLKSTLVSEIKSEHEIGKWNTNIIIDALFGTGISRQAEGLAAGTIRRINSSDSFVISIDLPSGMLADSMTPAAWDVVHADLTITFEVPKLCFFFSVNEKYTGKWSVAEIRLQKSFIDELGTKKYFNTQEQIRNFIEPRSKFSHKGTFGHALLVAGSHGMMGAAVLASRGCLRAGAGLLTTHVPKSGLTILQTSLPESIVRTDEEENFFSNIEDSELEKATAIGLGPGLGTHKKSQEGLRKLLSVTKPLLLDADALNMLSMNRNWLDDLPENTILTPHPKEFERLAGPAENDFARHEQLIEFSKKYKVIVVLKGAYTCIALPDGSCYFNSTGNPAMATAGSGDVLTGIILGLLAQNYSPAKAALLGVFLHGLAGDLAAAEIGPAGLLADDIADYVPRAIKNINR